MLSLCLIPVLVSPRKELLNLSGALIFTVSAQNKPLDYLALVAIVAMVAGPTGL